MLGEQQMICKAGSKSKSGLGKWNNSTRYADHSGKAL